MAGSTVVLVSRSFRFARQPRWLVLHAFVLAAVVTMVLLGRWQLQVSNRKGFSLQNSAYSVQWWAFALFAIFFWWRIVRDHARREDPVAAPKHEPVSYQAYVRPEVAPDTDPVNAAYNDYLARLAEDDSERRS
jgi:DNA-binding transcriptional regulator of glucitol operon